MEKWGIVFCPKGKNGKKEWQKFAQVLKAKKVDYDYVQSVDNTGVARFVSMMIDNNYKTIIIVGGDDDLNDAINTFMQKDLSIRQKVSLGVIPNGISNDFAKFWGIDGDNISETVDALIRCRTRKIDIGCIHYKIEKNGTLVACKRYFLNCVNIGLVAALANLRRQTRTFFFDYLGTDPLSYIFSTLLLGFQRLDYKMSLKINDEEIDGKIMTVCVSNARGYGQTPSAVPYNGKLDVSIVSNDGMTNFIEGAYMMYNKRFLNHKSVRPYRTDKVIFSKAKHALVSVDSRILSTPIGEFSIDIEQEVVNFIIP
ncbi:MAG: diacylglycerol kinase family protein [Prevotellaceae bacterium]|nr:diacylglycerol kinase family protein [Prevotellaceae bacterium]